MREAILLAVATPQIAAALFAVGWGGIVSEFLRPGKVLPGTVGGVLALLGLRSLLPEHAGLAAMVAGPWTALTLVLLWFARLARKSKLSAD